MKASIRYNKPIRVSVISLTCCIILSLCSCVSNNDASDLTTYKLDPKLCVIILGNQPEEFIDVQDSYFPWTDDFCTNAKVDKDGNLILTINNEQKINWRSAYMPHIQSARNAGVHISADCTEYTLRCYEENLLDMLYASPWAFMGCAVIQLLDGRNPQEITVKYSVIDAGTSEIKYTANYPQEEINFVPSHYEFTSMYD